MRIHDLQSEPAILTELGRRLARVRIDLNLTQADLAREAGISKRTVERIEDGASSQTSSLIRILRALDLLAGLDALVPQPRSRPMDLLRRKDKPRRRASSKRATARRRASDQDEPWKWGEDA